MLAPMSLHVIVPGELWGPGQWEIYQSPGFKLIFNANIFGHQVDGPFQVLDSPTHTECVRETQITQSQFFSNNYSVAGRYQFMTNFGNKNG